MVGFVKTRNSDLYVTVITSFLQRRSGGSKGARRATEDSPDHRCKKTVSVSVAFNDNDVRRLFESNTIDTEERINALRKLKTAGLRTSALICPVIPYITDVIPLIDMLAPHTVKIWIYGLSMLNRTDQNWQNVESILESHFPDVKAQIETIVFSQDHSYWMQLRQELLELQKERELHLSIHV